MGDFLDHKNFKISVTRLVKRVTCLVVGTWYLASVYFTIMNTNKMVAKLNSELTPQVQIHTSQIAVINNKLDIH